MRRLCPALLFAALLSLPAHPVGPPPPAARPPIDFARDIQPLLTAYCVECHGPAKQKGGLRLDGRSHAVSGGAIVPGDGAKSPLLHRVAGLGDGARMPPKGPRLSPKQIAILRAWIDQGAVWPDVATPVSPDKVHWAYRPLVRPAVPELRDRLATRGPIDRFIHARLERAGLSPAPEADRRTLIRRLSFDLLGLPPAPEDVDRFLSDKSPDAYERLVERLLSSPHHGERWARHWLDVVHFAETHGHDQDVPRESAWPYRDYLVASLNADVPYGRFVEEQVAGDILYPDSPQAIAATGLLAAGPWDESSQKDIRDDTLDKKAAQYLDRDDMVTTVMTAFAATTVHCARCHDHKFDPVSQEEHYALQAVFAGVDRAERPYDPDPAVHHRRLALKKRMKEIGELSEAALLRPEAQQAAAAWAKGRAGHVWHALEAGDIKTAHGSKPTKLPDRSVRFGGTRPARDTYTITAASALKAITAVRLEVLADDSLPHKGPGRQDNGNLHLNEFRVAAGSKAVKIGSATADFNQAGWTIAGAIDGKPATAWGIYPAVGRPHEAVFVFEKPVTNDNGVTLTFTLEQTHGGGHLIGRLRLSATSSEHPEKARPMPADIAAILDVESSKRTDAQRAALARHALRAQVEAALAALPAERKVYAAATDFPVTGSFRPAGGCRPVAVLKRGDITQPLRPAAPAALSLLPGHPGRFTLARPNDEGERRAALARWLSDPKNALTWRTMANRLWHHHFGRGLVATPGDLGRMGAAPTHPELLDWLACELRDAGSLKHLHRLIVTSAAYRRASRHDADAAKVDADNLLLWRMNRARLDAESVRDAALAVSGKLDRAMGGPSVKHFRQSPGIHVTPIVDYGAFDVDAPGSYRRSVYRFLFRTLPDPLFDVLDCPDASQFTAARSSSVTPLQALVLLNDRFLVRQAEHFARRVEGEAGDIAGQVRRAHRLALGRAPSVREAALLEAHARRHGLASACRVLWNCNEFLFVD